MLQWVDSEFGKNLSVDANIIVTCKRRIGPIRNDLGPNRHQDFEDLL